MDISQSTLAQQPVWVSESMPNTYDPLIPLIQHDIFSASCIEDLKNLRRMYGMPLPAMYGITM